MLTLTLSLSLKTALVCWSAASYSLLPRSGPFDRYSSFRGSECFVDVYFFDLKPWARERGGPSEPPGRILSVGDTDENSCDFRSRRFSPGTVFLRSSQALLNIVQTFRISPASFLHCLPRVCRFSRRGVHLRISSSLALASVA